MVDVKLVQSVVHLRVRQVLIKWKFYYARLVCTPLISALVIVSNLELMQLARFEVEEVAQGAEHHEQERE